MKKYGAILLVLVAVLAVGTVAFAKHPGRGGHGPMGGAGFFREFSFAHLEARLKLTPEQSNQIQQIGRTERDKVRDQFVGGADNRQALMKEIFRDNPNQSEINTRLQAMLQQHEQMLRELVGTGLQVNKVLTPEQRAEMQRVIDENAEAAKKMRERAEQRRRERMTNPETTPKQ